MEKDASAGHPFRGYRLHARPLRECRAARGAGAAEIRGLGCAPPRRARQLGEVAVPRGRQPRSAPAAQRAVTLLLVPLVSPARAGGAGHRRPHRRLHRGDGAALRGPARHLAAGGGRGGASARGGFGGRAVRQAGPGLSPDRARERPRPALPFRRRVDQERSGADRAGAVKPARERAARHGARERAGGGAPAWRYDPSGGLGDGYRHRRRRHPPHLRRVRPARRSRARSPQRAGRRPIHRPSPGGAARRDGGGSVARGRGIVLRGRAARRWMPRRDGCRAGVAGHGRPAPRSGAAGPDRRGR